MSYKTDIYSMKSNNNSSSGGGMGMLSWLQVIFIVLKVLKLIDWPWVKVFIPTWIGLGLLAIIVVLMVVVYR